MKGISRRYFKGLSCAVTALLFFISISACKSHSEADLTRLIKELSSTDKSVRNSAALNIASYGKDGARAVPPLINVLKNDPSRGIRTSAAYALRQIGTPEAIKALDEYKE